MPRKSEQEWVIIETDYIHNPVTYDMLSKKYHLSKQAVCARFIKNKIEDKRRQHLEQTGIKIQEHQSNIDAKENFNLLTTVEELIKEKSKAELLALKRYYKLAGDSISPMDLMKLINKSKDSCSELIKIAELLKGNATDRLDFQEQDRESEARNNRLNLLRFNN